MVSRRGRSLHEAVLRLFTVSPLHYDLADEVLPIPEVALRSSFDWFIRHGERTLDRRIERALMRSQGGPDEKVEIVLRMAGRQYRSASSSPPPTAELRPWPEPTRQKIESMNALSVAKFLGPQEIGSRQAAEIIAAVAPSTASAQEIESGVNNAEKTLARRELAGQDLLDFPRHVTIEEAVERINAVDIATFWELRDKLARVAEVGYILLILRDDKSERFLDAVYTSHTNVVLLYGAIPIAVTLETDAWHSMAALIAMMLTDDDAADWSTALDQLAEATRPELFM
jgi:hypothetical protein